MQNTGHQHTKNETHIKPRPLACNFPTDKTPRGSSGPTLMVKSEDVKPGEKNGEACLRIYHDDEGKIIAPIRRERLLVFAYTAKSI